MLHIYKDTELTQQISEGDMANPDLDTFNGPAGETKDRMLFLANEQTLLERQIDSNETKLPLRDARFQDGDYLIINSELMRVTAGGGTREVQVQRGLAVPSTPHLQGTVVYTACNYQDLVLQPIDVSGTDETAWCILAKTREELETSIPGSSLSFDSKVYNETLKFWRRITVPQGTPMQNKVDLKIRITGTECLI